MTECNQKTLDFPSFDRRKIEGSFSGGDVSSDGGVMLLRQADRRLGLTRQIDRVLHDPRDPDLITHRQVDLLRQRIYGIALGYEDLNDHDSLRKDLAWQTAVEREDELASSPTLCRLEARASRAAAAAMHDVMVEQFIASFAMAPAELILDFDAIDDRIHGFQQGRAYHGFYGDWCFLPLYVFCGRQLLVSYLRPSNIDPARHAWAILSLLVKRLRQAWPCVRIIMRTDSGFCRWKMLRWCDRHKVDHIVGLAKNCRLKALIAEPMEQAAAAFEASARKQRLFGFIHYAAATWEKERRVIYKADHGDKGANPRFVVTSMEGDASYLYDAIYCSRGEMENRIKEQQMGLFADRTSAHNW